MHNIFSKHLAAVFAVLLISGCTPSNEPEDWAGEYLFTICGADISGAQFPSAHLTIKPGRHEHEPSLRAVSRMRPYTFTGLDWLYEPNYSAESDTAKLSESGQLYMRFKKENHTVEMAVIPKDYGNEVVQLDIIVNRNNSKHDYLEEVLNPRLAEAAKDPEFKEPMKPLLCMIKIPEEKDPE